MFGLVICSLTDALATRLSIDKAGSIYDRLMLLDCIVNVLYPITPNDRSPTLVVWLIIRFVILVYVVSVEHIYIISVH